MMSLMWDTAETEYGTQVLTSLDRRTDARVSFRLSCLVWSIYVGL